MSVETAAPSVLTERRGCVLIITLNRPQVLNAITAELLDSMRVALGEAADDPQIRAVLITGAGRAFSSGQDLKSAADAGDPDVETMLREHYRPVIAAIRELPKPVLAAVNGVAAGAGFSLALAADIRIAGVSASFVQAFVRIGLVPDAGSSYFLPRIVGPARALELAMLGETIDSATAERFGLVSRVVEDAGLQEEALALATRLAAGPRSIGLIKQEFAASLDNNLETQLAVEERLQAEATRTADFVEGVSAFLQKRPASFSGR
ncbi:MAG: enoyl-CoA hydratase/isomerase family protein [Candidatus Dormibacteraeota bacterium]|nr:enoyl-CoA hydratase/isomerase family protein [Candidatus Dormibacteraeota bacterium]